MLVLPAVLALLAGYVAVHSPMRSLAAGLVGRTTGACYFTCESWLPPLGVLNGLVALGLAGVVVLAAWFVAAGFDGCDYEAPLVFGITALALLTVPAALIGGVASATGLALLRPPLGPLLTAVPAVLVLSQAVTRGWRPRLRFWRAPASPLVRFVGALGCALLAVSAVLGVLHPPTGWDPLSYHAPLAVYFWRDGNLTEFLNRAPDYAAWAHPGTTELWFGLLRVIGGERLANLGQLPFGLLGACAVRAFARRLGLREGAAVLASSAFLLAPLVVGQIEQQLNDVAAAGLLMATVALASAPQTAWTVRRLTVVGLALGLMAATKLVLLPSVVALGLVVAVSVFTRRQGFIHWRTIAARLALVGLLGLLVVSPWWTRNLVRYRNPVYPAAIGALGLTGLDQTTFSPRDTQYVGRSDTFGLPSGAAWLLYPLLESHTDQSGLGALLLVAALPGLVVAVWRRRSRPLAVYAVTTAATLAGWWTLTRHDPRFLLGIGGLGFAFVPWLLLAVPRPQRRLASAVVMITALFSAAVTTDQVLRLVGSLPQDRATFYDRIWGLDPAVESLTESEVLVFGRTDIRNADSLDYPLLGPLQNRLLVVLPNDFTALSTDAIVERMHGVGARYAYIAVENADLAGQVEARFNPSRFELAHFSPVGVVDPRCCFELRRSGDEARRYLYRLLPGQ